MNFRNIKSGERGFTLFELLCTLTVMTILVLGTIPLANTAVKRQREQQLRESLRLMRSAIDEFKRDTIGACQQGAATTSNPINQQQQNQNVPTDPRSRVVIDDCKIFTADNLDRYPPTLEDLVKGVKVKQRGVNLQTSGGAFGSTNATDLNKSESEEIIKVYLHAIPVDPMTGKDDTWEFRSSFQAADASSWDSINVFDVRSGSDEEALNGEKYSDW